MTSFWLAATTIVALAGGQPVHKPSGEEYAPKDGNFVVRFPGKPKETTQITKSAIGEVKVFTATYATSDGNVYMVSYSDLPTGATKAENLDTLFEGVREGAKGKDGEVLVGDRFEFKPAGLPAYNLELKKGNQAVRIQIIVSGDRLYQLAVVGSKNFVKEKAAEFLKSFELSK